MYRIDTNTNRIDQLKKKSFSELGFSERNHLQEWLANEPTVFGEELLIIQKEFDGFDDTRELLDLLAIDKTGNLVIIENKLDDSGRDVAWQAIKYASYCSSLTKDNIIQLFQAYLNRNGGGNASEMLVEFLEVSDLDGVILNSGNDQRIIFVAAKFRKEVTSTAMWLLSHGVSLQCFRATPHQMGEDIFLNIEQIIPAPETKEFMIGYNAKEADEKVVRNHKNEKEKYYLSFWQSFLDHITAEDTSLFSTISPSKGDWLASSSGLPGTHFAAVKGKSYIRVEFYFGRSNKDENLTLFELMAKKQANIEERFDKPLTWEPLPNSKACRVKYQTSPDIFDNSDEKIIKWLVDHVLLLEAAIRPELPELRTGLK